MFCETFYGSRYRYDRCCVDYDRIIFSVGTYCYLLEEHRDRTRVIYKKYNAENTTNNLYFCYRNRSKIKKYSHYVISLSYLFA